ncbi:Vta1 like-domain-containing protein [Mycena galopus ATCC 62051]|nr:Vta1 like-domain-containing protein [Mycena galopus ATCC 62051]
MALPATPVALKAVSPYLQRADELRAKEPIIAYWCTYYAAQIGIGLKAKDTASRNFLFELLGTLEKMKKDIGPTDAIDIEAASAAFVENFALRVFGMADNEDRSGAGNRSTAKKFLAAANFLELQQAAAPPSFSSTDSNASGPTVRGSPPSQPPPPPSGGSPPKIKRTSPRMEPADIANANRDFSPKTPPRRDAGLNPGSWGTTPQEVIDIPLPHSPLGAGHQRTGSGSSSGSRNGGLLFKPDGLGNAQPHVSDTNRPGSNESVKKSVHFTPSVGGLSSTDGGTPPVSPTYYSGTPQSRGRAQGVLYLIMDGPALGLLFMNLRSPHMVVCIPLLPLRPPRQAACADAGRPSTTHFRHPTNAIVASSPSPPEPEPEPVELSPAVIAKAQKHCRFAISALDYEDAEQARRELRAALAVLGG